MEPPQCVISNNFGTFSALVHGCTYLMYGLYHVWQSKPPAIYCTNDANRGDEHLRVLVKLAIATIVVSGTLHPTKSQ